MERFLLDGTVSGRLGRAFPFGTLAVNISRSSVLGVLAGAALTDDAYRVLGTGLVGAFSTFSTWALESHRLGEVAVHAEQTLPAFMRSGSEHRSRRSICAGLEPWATVSR